MSAGSILAPPSNNAYHVDEYRLSHSLRPNLLPNTHHAADRLSQGTNP